MLVNITQLEKSTQNIIKLKGANVESTQNPAKSTKSTEQESSNNEQIKQGNLALRQVVRGLLSLGMSELKIYDTLLHYNYIYKYIYNLSKKELYESIHDILNRKDKILSTYEEIKSYVETTEGEFSLKDVCEMTQVDNTKAGKNKASAVLSRLVKENIIERVGKKNGTFRRINTDLEEIDWLNAMDESVDMWLPFRLHEMVKIHYGNIILIAGEPNAGKTALCFNIIRYNMDKWSVHYFNSEMGASEMKDRIKNFPDIAPSDWKFKAYERAGEFEDTLFTGKGNINIIDFLEIHDEFYKVGGILKKIHDKLDGAIAVICLQKDVKKDIGRGGISTLEKPRLVLAMSSGYTKIVKAKNPKNNENHNGKILKWEINGGCWFREQGKWFRKGEKTNG